MAGLAELLPSLSGECPPRGGPNIRGDCRTTPACCPPACPARPPLSAGMLPLRLEPLGGCCPPSPAAACPAPPPRSPLRLEPFGGGWVELEPLSLSCWDPRPAGL